MIGSSLLSTEDNEGNKVRSTLRSLRLLATYRSLLLFQGFYYAENRNKNRETPGAAKPQPKTTS
jgi:hypothetical protein